LGAIISAAHEEIARVLRRLEMFRHVPHEVVTAFLRRPNEFRRLADLRRTLRTSRGRAHGILRSSQRFKRAEHLFTALRCATWAFLTSEGLERSAVEEYLGIVDRPDFRRSCDRAGLPAPRLGIGLKTFSA
jgi:hypothetical protein